MNAGDTNGRLTLLTFCENISGRKSAVFVCRCGTEIKRQVKLVVSGNTLSCGCLRRDLVASKNSKHGESKRSQRSDEYIAWKAMHRRCVSRETYIENGITVCDRWSDFSLFLADMGRKPSSKHSVERKENTKGYFPENCVWATDLDQANNKSTNVTITHNGQKMTIAQFARTHRLSYSKVLRTHHKGVDVSSLLNETVKS